MFHVRDGGSRLLMPSVLAVFLYCSHFSIALLDRAVFHARISYLTDVHFERTAKRKAELEKFSSIVEKEKITDAITKIRPKIKDKAVEDLANVICRVGRNYDYDPMFILAIILTESSLRDRAVSRVGAMGLMQIRPFVGKRLADETDIEWEGRKTLFDPQINVRLGTYYLGKLYKKFDGDLRLALEAYNNGPTMVKSRIDRYGYFSSPYPKRVFSAYNMLKKDMKI